MECLTIRLDCEDEYTGEVIRERGVAAPHGRGTLRSCSGRHCYTGEFSHGWRDGYGEYVTDRYALWCRWRMNRPDLTNSCRVDYPNGDRYCGFLALQTDPAASKALRACDNGSAGRVSKFSSWAQSTSLVRVRWGELVTAAGDRYFGEWEKDRPHGFGGYAARSGDRYVGRFRQGKFCGTGTLFSLSYAQDGISGLPEGAFLSSTNADNVGAAPPRSVCVFDGVWEEGRFLGEGHVTLPGGTRVSADWRSSSQPVDGEVVFKVAPGCLRSRRGPLGGPPDRGVGGGWHECFHWEPLLCGAPGEVRKRELEASKPFRDRLTLASNSGLHGGCGEDGGRSPTTTTTGSAESLRAILLDFLGMSHQLRAAVRVFRRFFFFFYGTCGHRGEIAAGRGGNALGWCSQRNPFGGCIHASSGRAVTAADLHSALGDLFSFTRSALRWTADMLGDDLLRRMDAANVPVDLTVGRWTADTVLADTHDVLLNLYSHVYAAEGAEVDKALGRLRGRATLDDMGVAFARRYNEERLFDPYADAVHCIEQLGEAGHTLSSKLAVLAQWARDIDLSTRLAQVSGNAPPRASSSSSSVHVAAAPLTSCSVTAAPSSGRALQSGSADDLLPIYQYVLSQARLRHLYAHTRMLADFAEEPTYVDATSHDSFCVTHFEMCAMTLPRLHLGLRDRDGVLVPASFFDDRLCSALARIPLAARSGAVRTPDLSAEDLASIALGYLAGWLPDVLVCLAAAPRPLPGVVHFSVAGSADARDGLFPAGWRRAALLDSLLDSLGGDAGGDTGAVRDFCWRAAGSVLDAVGITWGLCPSSSSSDTSAAAVEIRAYTLDTEDAGKGARVDPPSLPALCIPADMLSSFLLRVAGVLREQL